MANLSTRNNDLRTFGGDLFDNFFTNVFGNGQFNVDIEEKDNKYEVKADLPGFEKKDLKVQYDDGVLTIEANREDTLEDKDEAGNFLRKERSTSSYQRQFLLKNVDEEKIQAAFKDGVLSLELPKSETEDDRHKQIEIN